jgi:hypothetical protein
MITTVSSEAQRCISALTQARERLLVDILEAKYSAQSKTRELTDALCLHITYCNGRPEREYPVLVDFPWHGRSTRMGYVDVFARFRDRSMLAVELDRGNKAWSLAKLRYCNTVQRTEALWVRWQGLVTPLEDKAVHVLNLCTKETPPNKLRARHRRSQPDEA